MDSSGQELCDVLLHIRRVLEPIMQYSSYHLLRSSETLTVQFYGPWRTLYLRGVASLWTPQLRSLLANSTWYKGSRERGGTNIIMPSAYDSNVQEMFAKYLSAMISYMQIGLINGKSLQA